MDFFGMGTGEVLLIIIAALIIWGPGRIVEIARMLGKAVRTLRKVTSDLTTAVTKEVVTEEQERSFPPRANGSHKTKGLSDTGTAEPASTEMTGPRD